MKNTLAKRIFFFLFTVECDVAFYFDEVVVCVSVFDCDRKCIWEKGIN